MYQKYVTLRDAAGKKDSEVARDLGISSSCLCDWKAGRYTPKMDKISAIAKYFGVPLEYFVEG